MVGISSVQWGDTITALVGVQYCGIPSVYKRVFGMVGEYHQYNGGILLVYGGCSILWEIPSVISTVEEVQ